MKLVPLVIRVQQLSEKEKKEILQLQELIPELNRRNIPQEIAEQINEKLVQLNNFSGSKQHYLKKIRSSKKGIFELLQKRLGLVPPNYYTNLWMPLGMSIFGLPLGAVLSAITKNSSFIGIGLPIGLAIGAWYGKNLDKKAAKEKKVLDLS